MERSGRQKICFSLGVGLRAFLTIYERSGIEAAALRCPRCALQSRRDGCSRLRHATL
jgi:hypothetical protein